MPRGKYYPEETRQEARRLRRDGWSLNEISAKLGPPKNTLTLWVRGIELTSEQRTRLFEREHQELGRNRALAAVANRQARLARINVARQQAKHCSIRFATSIGPIILRPLCCTSAKGQKEKVFSSSPIAIHT